MTEYQLLTVLAAFVFLYSIIASRLEKTPINGAVVYLFAGVIFGTHCFDLIQAEADGGVLRLLAELTLALVLFSDSATASLSVLKKVRNIPIRLLLIGLPLTIVAGLGSGYVIFDNLSFYELALLATMLAPTDAALGQAVVTNQSVPSSVRQSLNVESGLNDGICVPVILIFLALATGAAGGDETASLVLRLPLQAIGIGAAVGVAMALVGNLLLKGSATRGWIAGSWIQIPIVALAILSFALAQRWGGSGFIAAFVGGLVFGGIRRNADVKEQLLEGAESTGNVLSMLTWFLFGALLVGKGFDHFSWRVIAYAVLSLTVVRMFPVWLCLLGIPMKLDSKLFLGWFGPRGLASIVFVVMVIDAKLPGNDTISAVVIWTVALSILAHGISAVPLANNYGQRVTARDGTV